MEKIETTDQMKARWAREQVADKAAVSLGLARQTKQHGIMYWTGNGEQFRAGYWAGREEPAAVAVPEGEQLKALKAKTACCMGVGNGDGNLFVYGDYDSIKAAQALVLRAEAKAAVQAVPVALPFAILDEEMSAFRRFDECVRDGQGYDVPKPMMNRLAELGLVRRVSANFYEHTTFGCAVINGYFDTASQAQHADALDAAFEAVRKRFCKLSRYSFLLDGKGNVRRVPNFSGHWVDFEEAHKLFDPQSVEAAMAAAQQGGAS